MNRIYILVGIMLSASAHSQPPSQEELIGQALADYGKVAGAWHLNQACSLLNKKRAAEFESNVATITVAMRNDLPNPNILYQIQASSKKVSQSEPYSSCGKKAKEVIFGAFELAKNWSKQIKLLQSGSKS